VRRPGRRTVTITKAQAVIVLQALADAEAYRRRLAAAWCDACATTPAAACDSHLDDLDQADAYRALAADLGREGSDDLERP